MSCSIWRSPLLKTIWKFRFWSIWVRARIRRNRRRNAHRTRAFVQCAEMQMSSLQHGEGCDCAAVKSCPGCQSWIIPRKGKASISRRGGGGEGTSLWQDTQTWPTLLLIRGIVEDTLHLNEWFYVSVLREPTSISWIQANILCLTDCDFHSRVHRWLLQGCEGIISVFFVFCYLCILSLSLFVILFVWLLFMFWVEVKSPCRPDPWVETRLSLSPMMIFRLHQVYSFQIIVQKGNFTSDNTVKHWETLWFIVAIVQRPPPVLSPPPWLGLPSGPALICTTSL